MRRPKRLNGEFVRRVGEPGRYGDGRGSFGLSLLVKETRGGLSKNWTQRLWQRNGRMTSVGLGAYPAVTLDRAREAAARNALAVKAGEDVLTDRMRIARLSVPTFRQAAERVAETYEPSWRGSRTAIAWRARLNEYVYPSLGDIRVDAITSADIYGLLAPIWIDRRATASKVRSAINAVMTWALAQGFISASPTAAVGAALPRGGAKVQHRPAISWAELPAALIKVDASGAAPVTKLVVRFLALSAARSGEVRRMKWEEVDRSTACWTIPGERMKQGKPHRVPLSGAALGVLSRAAELSGDVGLVFPSRGDKPISEGALSKLFGELELGFVPHGLRATFRVWAAEAGVPRELAEHALAHVVGSEAERAYARTDLFELRRGVMARWADAIAANA